MDDQDFLKSEPPIDPHDTRPAGRARQRIAQRRRERSSEKARDPSHRRGLEQLAPAGGFRLPDFRVPRNQIYLAYVVGALFFIVVIVLVLGRLRNDSPERPPNAIWIGTEWTYETHEDQAIEQLVADLRERKIGTIYAWVSWLQPDETWRGVDNFDKVRAFVEQFKRFYPEAELLGWISLPVDDGQGYRLDQTDVQEKVVQFSQTTVDEFNFDGVFLNVEPVWNDDDNFLSLVRQVRAALPEGTLIGAAIPPDWSPLNADIPVPPLIVPGTVWDDSFKQSAALLLDQMAVMSYNSGLSSSSDYTLWTAYQVKTFAQAIDALGAGATTELIIGIPTYDAEPPGHDPLVENVTSAADGIKLGLQQAGEAARLVRGAAIYAGWETDEQEWTQFEQSWLQR
ncbi:MAG: hypothetical protein IH587_10160 [Anaerolineae bacterium]|nr:hypothetical protein [Anaerolineae bacterium]